MAPANGDGDLMAERVFVGAGCNRIVNNVSWGQSGLVAFGAQNAVAIFCPQVTFSDSFLYEGYLLFYKRCLLCSLFIYVFFFDEQSAQILTTLPGHKAVVNCTQWVLTNKDVHKGFDILFTFY